MISLAYVLENTYDCMYICVCVSYTLFNVKLYTVAIKLLKCMLGLLEYSSVLNQVLNHSVRKVICSADGFVCP